MALPKVKWLTKGQRQHVNAHSLAPESLLQLLVFSLT